MMGDFLIFFLPGPSLKHPNSTQRESDERRRCARRPGTPAHCPRANPSTSLRRADMAPFTMGLPAFMSSMSNSAVVGVGVSAVTVVGVSVYTIFRASSTFASPARVWRVCACVRAISSSQARYRAPEGTRAMLLGPRSRHSRRRFCPLLLAQCPARFPSPSPRSGSVRRSSTASRRRRTRSQTRRSPVVVCMSLEERDPHVGLNNLAHGA